MSEGADEGKGRLDRRRFLGLAGAGAAGALVAGAVPSAARGATSAHPAPAVRTGRAAPDIAVIGAGAFGAWTALYLQRMGASVQLVDAYGVGNSRATSGGETRGVRSSYGNEPHGLLWARWAREAMKRWQAFDEEWSDSRLYFTTGDVILREEMPGFLENTARNWEELGIPHEVLDADEVRRRWPVMDTTDLTVALYEPDAGVVRARRAIEAVGELFQRAGGEVRVARVTPGSSAGGRMDGVTLDDSGSLSAGTYVFALGPWFPKVFPELMGKRLRTSAVGHVIYFATPPGDHRFTWPNLPSWNYPGVTGWPALGPDHRGFRVRGSGARHEDPDTSDRRVTPESMDRMREFVRARFPALGEQPVSETRGCHYESSVDGNFFIDTHPEMENVWLTGGGSAEAFKQGPVLGDYIAHRILDQDLEPELAEGFRLKEEEFEESEPSRGA